MRSRGEGQDQTQFNQVARMQLSGQEVRPHSNNCEPCTHDLFRIQAETLD